MRVRIFTRFDTTPRAVPRRSRRRWPPPPAPPRTRACDVHADGPLVPDGAASGAAPRPDAGGLHVARLRGRPDADASTLGLLVTGVTYRHPGLLAKIVTTLDVLSGGRALLGLGAAWYEREHLAPRRAVPAAGASGSSASRRRCRSASRCGATTTGRTTAGTTSWRRRSARPGRSSEPRPPILDRRQRRAEDAAPRRAVRRRVQPLRASPTRSRTSSRCWPATARPRAATRPRSSARSVSERDPLDDVDGFVAAAGVYARLGVTTVDLVPTGDPVAFVERVGTELIPRLADLDRVG